LLRRAGGYYVQYIDDVCVEDALNAANSRLSGIMGEERSSGLMEQNIALKHKKRT
jgi:hypothetical protein